MLKQTLYTYLGNNGFVTTPVVLEGLPFMKRICLAAEKDNILIKDGVKRKTVTVPEKDVENWVEVPEN